jgi:hypothetical protein
MIIDLDTKNYINPKHIEEMWTEKGAANRFYVKAALSSGKVTRIEGPYTKFLEAERRIEQIAKVW